jgi:hypothetical protein
MRLGPFNWVQARIAVANDRQEQLRLPGVKMGLVKKGIMQPSKEGDLKRHHKWLDSLGLEEWDGIPMQRM